MSEYTAYKQSLREPPRDEEPKKKKTAKPFSFPWAYIIVAAIPLSLLAFYCTVVAPPRLPIPASVQVPFPALTDLLQELCIWCDHNPLTVVAGVLGILVLGLIVPLPSAQYYVPLAILAALTLFLAYYSISAPIDRLLRTVQDNLPKR